MKGEEVRKAMTNFFSMEQGKLTSPQLLAESPAIYKWQTRFDAASQPHHHSRYSFLHFGAALWSPSAPAFFLRFIQRRPRAGVDWQQKENGCYSFLTPGPTWQQTGILMHSCHGKAQVLTMGVPAPKERSPSGTRHWRLHYPALTLSQVHREQYYLDLQTQRLLKHADISWLNVMLPPIKRLPRLQSFFQMQTFPSSHARPYARGKRATPFLNTDYRVLWWLGRLRIPCCHCCGVGWPLAWELLHVMNVAKKKNPDYRQKPKPSMVYMTPHYPSLIYDFRFTLIPFI